MDSELSRETLRPITICGAGIAGLALGIKVRLHGVPVLIVERSKGLRPQVKGEYFQPVVIPWLRALGVYDELLTSKAVVISRVSHLYSGRFDQSSHRFVAEFSQLGSGTHGLSLVHEKILEVFRKRFAELGGELLEGAHLDGLKLLKSSCAYQIDGRPEQSQFFVGCDGKLSSTRKMAGVEVLSEKLEASSRIMIASFVRGLRVPHGEFVTEECDEGVLYAFHSNAGAVRVYWCVPKSKFDQMRNQVEEQFLRTLSKSIIGRNCNIAIDGPISAMPTLDRLGERRVKGRAVWVGDAAGTVDPLCGHGMSLSVDHAIRLADILGPLLRNPNAVSLPGANVDSTLRAYDKGTLRDFLHTRFLGQWIGRLFMNSSSWAHFVKRRAISRYNADESLKLYTVGLFAGLHKESFGVYDLPYLLGLLPTKIRQTLKGTQIIKSSTGMQNALLTTPPGLLLQKIKSLF